MPFDFQQLANFRLARGSHKQPNKDGNICVNEAAVIAAGFQYREIRDASCLPNCFSRPVSEYAIYLNDLMMHRMRNELLVPFVTPLPGTSDAPWIEKERARLIVVETVRRIVAAEYDEIWRKPKLAEKCRAVQLFEQVSPAMAKAQAVLPLESAKTSCAAAAQAAARSKIGPLRVLPTSSKEHLMAVTLYSGFVPVCVQLLTGLKTVLKKAEEHATTQKWDTAVVLNLRFYPDMFPLERQVRQVCNHALGAARVAGVGLPIAAGSGQ